MGEKGKGGAAIYFDGARRGVFLEALRESCHLGRAAAAAGVSSSTVYQHRNRDAAFHAAMLEAQDDGAGRLRQRMLDEAIDAAALPEARDAAGRTNSRLAARLGSVGRGGGGVGGVGGSRGAGGRARALPRALPRAEVDRRLLEAIERLSRRAKGER